MSATRSAAAVPVDDHPIAAVATAPGRGAVGIVRVSGGDLQNIIAGILPRRPPPRRAVFTSFLAADGEAMDNGVALYFPAPHSFTGQEVLELQGHGGPGVLRRVLTRCFELGARAAEPGEFSLRAYLNGKLDLAQAEAVADLVNAESDSAARAAMRSLTGEFSRAIHSAAAALERARVEVEATMDFADEELGENDGAATALTTALTELESLRARAGEGALLTEGVTAAIVGPPNVGKSSLLNRLCGEAAAIVAPTPGTTRDAVARDILTEGLRIHLSDTAGLRENAGEVEREGIRRARQIAEDADVILSVSDGREPHFAGRGLNPRPERSQRELNSRPPRTILVRNKIDLDEQAPGVRDGVVHVSAKTGEGLTELRGELLRVAGFCSDGEPPFAARARQLRALDEALQHARRAQNDWPHPELAADGLRNARDALTGVIGAFGDEELLGEIFSRFCIGK